MLSVVNDILQFELKDRNMKDSMNSCKYFRDEYNQHLKIKNQTFNNQRESSSGYYVCIRTMTVSGPDHEPVSREDCQNGRGCYLGG